MRLEGLFYQIIGPDRKFYHLPVFGLLRILAFFYRGIQSLRAFAYRKAWLAQRRLGCRVVSVGNLVLGGTGKTPTVVWIAETLKRSGFRPAVLCRGYGGNAAGEVTVVSDGTQCLTGTAEVGDEPVMIARRLGDVPVLAGKERYATGQYAIDRFKTDVLVLDDGYQHLPLGRDLNILLLDDQLPFGNGHVFPAGTLREPLTAIERADLVCSTRCEEPGNSRPLPGTLVIPQIRTGLKFIGWFDLEGRPIASDSVESLPVAAFCGVARPESFRHLLGSLNLNMACFESFPDHYSYTPRDVNALSVRAQQAGARWLVTTEKDAVKLVAQAFSLPVAVARIDLTFHQGEALLVDRLKSLGEVCP